MYVINELYLILQIKLLAPTCNHHDRRNIYKERNRFHKFLISACF